MRHVGLNMGQVKKANRSLILNYICESGPVSRKDIAVRTGLTPAAVTQICNEFMKEELLFETGEVGESKGAGRKKILVDINYDYAYIFAVNMEQGQTTVALCNMKGDVKEIQTLETKITEGPRELLQKVAEICKKQAVLHKDCADKIAGVSVAITGIVDKEAGRSIRAYGIWKEEVKVCQILEEATGYPVILENNVNAFAVAELLYGIGKKNDNLLVIKWGPGVGSTIVIDNKVYEGRNGKAAELGHFIVDKDGATCNCGRRGCLETKVSYRALSAKDAFSQKAFGDAYRKAKELGESKHFDEAIDLFARAIVNSMTILAPNRVVLCGNLFADEEIRRLLIENCMRYDVNYNETRIQHSTLADREDYIGPVANFVQNMIF